VQGGGRLWEWMNGELAKLKPQNPAGSAVASQSSVATSSAAQSKSE